MILTEEGKKVSKDVTEIVKNHIEKLPKVFSDEDKETLMLSLKKFRETLEKEVAMKI